MRFIVISLYELLYRRLGNLHDEDGINYSFPLILDVGLNVLKKVTKTIGKVQPVTRIIW